MSQQSKTVSWAKPEVARMGKLADVAGAQVPAHRVLAPRAEVAAPGRLLRV
jgi:hypothetical protein